MKKINRIFYGAPPASSANTVWTPEVLAQEALMAFEDELMLGNLVYRDYDKEIAKWGQVINVGVPGSFTPLRRNDNDDVTFVEGTSTSINVVLNQYIYSSFYLGDIGSGLSRENLLNIHLMPAVRAVAEGVEYAISGELRNFLSNPVGKLGTKPTKSTLIDAKKVLDNNKVPQFGRVLMTTHNSGNDLLGDDIFEIGDAGGDIGRALKTGRLGTVLGMESYQSGYMPSYTTETAPLETTDGTITIDAAGSVAAVGATTIVVADAKVGAGVVAGRWFVGTDKIPHLITGVESDNTDTTVTFTPALRAVEANPTVLTVVSGAAIHAAGAQSAGYSKALTLAGTGLPVAPAAGQLITVGGTNYGVWSGSTRTSLILNTALDDNVANSAVVGSVPAGDYSFAFVPSAIALVTRPLLAPTEHGVKSFTASYNGLSLRVLMGFDMSKNQYRVTVDTLCGVKTIRDNAGVVILS